jgi:hypothetical protein
MLDACAARRPLGALPWRAQPQLPDEHPLTVHLTVAWKRRVGLPISVRVARPHDSAIAIGQAGDAWAGKRGVGRGGKGARTQSRSKAQHDPARSWACGRKSGRRVGCTYRSNRMRPPCRRPAAMQKRGVRETCDRPPCPARTAALVRSHFVNNLFGLSALSLLQRVRPEVNAKRHRPGPCS